MDTGSFPGGKVRPGRAADHSLPSSAAVMEEQSYTSTHPLGHTGPVTGSLNLFFYPSIGTQRQEIREAEMKRTEAYSIRENQSHIRYNFLITSNLVTRISHNYTGY